MADQIRPESPSTVGALDGLGNSALLVRVPGAVCAIPAAQVIETMRPLPVEPLANLPDFVRGVALIRGAAVPILELGAVLDAAREPAMPANHAARFVTLRVGERCVALVVDSVVGLEQVNPQNLGEMPPLLQNARRDVIQAIGTLDAELLLVLETARLVPEAVWSEVDKARAPGSPASVSLAGVKAAP